ncbi:MAG TPA: hypothetical protein PLI77_09800, partial [Bacteroidales bacterium]|nr:hypothetical protein [Bacteroidales bacterium]
ASYVYWYNRKYDRTGHLFQDRYKSEAVETDHYMFAVLRYIHQNPLKAGMVNHIVDYPYSSYAEYIGLNNEQYVDKDFALSLFHEEKEQALADFRDFNEMATDEKFLDISDRKHISDKAAIDLIKKKYKVASSLELQSFEVEKRAKAVQFFLNKGMSARQIIRVTGISRYFIEKV